MSTPSLALFFIADGQKLERQSWLLAVTLFHAHAGDARIKLIAYTSPEYRPQISLATQAIFEACNVELRDLPPPPQWKNNYPHGNKIVAACDNRSTSHSLFLDTDMVCMSSLAEFIALPDQKCAAAPEGRRTWGPLDRWKRAYAHFGMEMPEERIRLLRARRAEYVPYFNAGFVAFSEAPNPESQKRFAEHWLETALDFDHNCSIANKRPWLDQITLPLTLARFSYDISILSEHFNYSLSNRPDYLETPDAAILHYHRFRFLAQVPQWANIKEQMRDTVPTAHHAELEEYLSAIEQAPLDDSDEESTGN